MSRGTRITPLRIPADLLDKIDQAVARTNRTRTGEPYNRTSWIFSAIREKLAKLERGRGERRRQGPQPGPQGEQDGEDGPGADEGPQGT